MGLGLGVCRGSDGEGRLGEIVLRGIRGLWLCFLEVEGKEKRKKLRWGWGWGGMDLLFFGGGFLLYILVLNRLIDGLVGGIFFF